MRSRPYSRHAPQFNSEALRGFLAARGIGYTFMGDRLGGLPEDERKYDEGGRVLYSELARSEGSARGIEELLSLAEGKQVAVMCGEEDPHGCHRSLLIGRVLVRMGADVAHIRGDGRLERFEPGEAQAPGGQTEMFPTKEEEWKSIRSVLPAGRRRDSSRR